jgi:hypothetical protein
MAIHEQDRTCQLNSETAEAGHVAGEEQTAASNEAAAASFSIPGKKQQEQEPESKRE